MSIFTTLTEKSWATPGLNDRMAALPDEHPEKWDKGVGLGVFLLVVTVLFGLLASAYLMRMGVHEGHGGGNWHRMKEPPLLWFNTGLLAASSLAFQYAVNAARAGEQSALRRFLVSGGLFGVGFLIGQALLWIELTKLGRAAENPALSFFYLISVLHGLHIVGGLIAWAVPAVRLFGGNAAAELPRSVQLCARYWHFMLFVWFVMLGLFVST